MKNFFKELKLIFEKGGQEKPENVDLNKEQNLSEPEIDNSIENALNEVEATLNEEITDLDLKISEKSLDGPIKSFTINNGNEPVLTFEIDTTYNSINVYELPSAENPDKRPMGQAFNSISEAMDFIPETKIGRIKQIEMFARKRNLNTGQRTDKQGTLIVFYNNKGDATLTLREDKNENFTISENIGVRGKKVTDDSLSKAIERFENEIETNTNKIASN